MKTTKHKKMNNMFPLRKDFTNMKTRKNEKYEITLRNLKDQPYHTCKEC